MTLELFGKSEKYAKILRRKMTYFNTWTNGLDQWSLSLSFFFNRDTYIDAF